MTFKKNENRDEKKSIEKTQFWSMEGCFGHEHLHIRPSIAKQHIYVN